jgi:hypothetical protein
MDATPITQWGTLRVNLHIDGPIGFTELYLTCAPKSPGADAWPKAE